ncbi:hypothetical protein [Phenylobacterium sp.]|uniref:hypothetical protein n=1 Tax=Phenylobacterium sp. TaxID=1871053 RepID=UPI0027342C77|nr:hypothetical protein [Phenylobacterium sp.]MDP3854374.1 hypothetical protein [Phenylobacterium sp.]
MDRMWLRERGGADAARDAYFQRSASEIEAARRQAEDAGRRVWNAAIGSGRSVLARTTAELEALGRAQLQLDEAQRRQTASLASGFGARTGAVGDFGRNYRDMRVEDRKNTDKYFHCKANCQAASRGGPGALMAEKLSNLREIYGQRVKGDELDDVLEDQAANRHGRHGGSAHPERVCSTTCERFRPPGLDSRY